MAYQSTKTYVTTWGLLAAFDSGGLSPIANFSMAIRSRSASRSRRTNWTSVIGLWTLAR